MEKNKHKFWFVNISEYHHRELGFLYRLCTTYIKCVRFYETDVSLQKFDPHKKWALWATSGFYWWNSVKTNRYWLVSCSPSTQFDFCCLRWYSILLFELPEKFQALMWQIGACHRYVHCTYIHCYPQFFQPIKTKKHFTQLPLKWAYEIKIMLHSYLGYYF